MIGRFAEGWRAVTVETKRVSAPPNTMTLDNGMA
jgi:hypothetical protein